MKESLISKSAKSQKTLELVFCVKGRILRYIVPAFNVIDEVVLKDAYSKEEWDKNGSDSRNYKKQLENACIEFGKRALDDPYIREQLSDDEINTLLSGKCPDRLTPHHAYPVDDDLVMQLVDREEHKDNPHYGSSDMANPRQKEKHIRDLGNWDISNIEKVQGWLYHTIHKNKHITSGTVGVSIAGITGVLMKKVLKVKDNRIVAVVSLGLGVISCFACECCLNNKNEKFL